MYDVNGKKETHTQCDEQNINDPTCLWQLHVIYRLTIALSSRSLGWLAIAPGNGDGVTGPLSRTAAFLRRQPV